MNNDSGVGTMNILFLRAGSFSNLNSYLYHTMCQAHNIVQNVDAGRTLNWRSLRLTPWRNMFHAILQSRTNWQQMHSKNTFSFSQMTKYCNQIVRSRTDYDLIFQTQCKFSITENPYSHPYYIYTDLTQKLTDRLWKRWALKGSSKETKAWLQMESEAYQRAEKIFTFSDSVKDSFINDYNIEADKIIVVGSGINSNQIAEVNLDQKDVDGLTLFFLSTEFERMGGHTVLKSYQLIKQQRLNIKLIIGGKTPNLSADGIEVYHHLTRDMIEKLYQRSTIFLMPGKLGGLQSVLEAMNKKCVCIVGDSNLLLTDVVKDNHTGFVVQTDNPFQLAEKIIELYNHPSRVKRIANQAYSFATANFTWDQIVQKMTLHFK